MNIAVKEKIYEEIENICNEEGRDIEEFSDELLRGALERRKVIASGGVFMLIPKPGIMKVDREKEKEAILALKACTKKLYEINSGIEIPFASIIAFFMDSLNITVEDLEEKLNEVNDKT